MTPQNNKQIVPKIKVCKQCQLAKPVTDFSPVNVINNGVKYYYFCALCKPCNAQRKRTYRNSIGGKEQVKITDHKKYLKHTYNLTLEQEQYMLIAQDNKCAICYSNITATNKAIDHNHKTKIVRGILCNRCNWGIGQFDESPARMLSAIAYLKKEQYSE